MALPKSLSKSAPDVGFCKINVIYFTDLFHYIFDKIVNRSGADVFVISAGIGAIEC